VFPFALAKLFLLQFSFYARRKLSVAIMSVRPSHGWISQKSAS